MGRLRAPEVGERTVSEDSDGLHEPTLQPVEWWRRPVEIVANMTIVAAAGAPVAVATESVYLAAATGIVALTLCNVAYWKYRGIALTEVYDGLKPWV
jgi:hypothetical protein